MDSKRQPRERNPREPHNLEEMLSVLQERAETSETVSIESLMDAVGRRSFGPLILLIGILALSPLSGIPTIPSILGILVFLIAGQLVVGREQFWLPEKLLKRELPGKPMRKALEKAKPLGRFTDRILRPRLSMVTRHAGTSVIAIICAVIGLTMPPLEIVPFLATVAGVALTLFGLALISKDGVVAILAILLTCGLVGIALGQWVI